jgi:hypothetical protein
MEALKDQLKNNKIQQIVFMKKLIHSPHFPDIQFPAINQHWLRGHLVTIDLEIVVLFQISG